MVVPCCWPELATGGPIALANFTNFKNQIQKTIRECQAGLVLVKNAGSVSVNAEELHAKTAYHNVGRP